MQSKKDRVCCGKVDRRLKSSEARSLRLAIRKKKKRLRKNSNKRKERRGTRKLERRDVQERKT